MPKTILLIDDDLAIHLQTKIVVEKAGFEFQAATSGEEGLQLARRHTPDLIVLDFLMPEKDGWETYSEFVADYETSCREMPPVIMLTAASHTTEQKEKLLESGISAYLEKPFGPRELVNVMENVFVTSRINSHGISLRQAVEENRNFLENLIDSCPVLIATTDTEGNVTYVNHVGRHLFKSGKGAVIGRHLTSLLPEVGPLCHDLLGSSVKAVGPESRECRLENAGSDAITLGCICSQLRNRKGQLNGLLIVAQDISAEKRLAQELIEKERLTAITESFATINHKLNNPLTPILGNLQLLREGEGRCLTQENCRSKLDVIEQNARKISEIVKSFGQMTVPVTKRYYGDANTLEFVKED